LQMVNYAKTHWLEVGSVPNDTKVKMKLKGPHGKVHTHESKIKVKLSKELAKKKGVKIDEDGFPILHGNPNKQGAQKSSTVGRFFKRLFGLD